MEIKDKDSLRKEMIQLRKGFDEDFIMRASAIMTARFMQIWSDSYNSFTLYSPLPGEVDTTILRDILWSTGRNVMFPKVVGDTLVLGRCTSEEDLEPGFGGILEPKEVNPEYATHVIVVPMLAFDPQGYRLGHGDGYYDRFLENAERAITIGLAFDKQLVPTIFAEPHDVPVDIILTEEGVYQCYKERE